MVHSPVLDRTAALEVANQAVDGITFNLESAQELRDGWFFAYTGPLVGSSGVIVNKRSGAALQLGSAFPVKRDLQMYERGYQFELYDLVIVKVNDREATLKILEQLRLVEVNCEYEHGTVWRIPRTLQRYELEPRLDKVPVVFGAQCLYFNLELLERARELRCFEFEAHECLSGG